MELEACVMHECSRVALIVVTLVVPWPVATESAKGRGFACEAGRGPA